MNQPGGYYSYLLRIWHIPTNGVNSWRLLLENIQTGEKCGFATLEGLVAYLNHAMADTGKRSGEENQNKMQG